MKRVTVSFVTSNTHKVEEAKYVLRNYPLEVKHLNAKRLEIQAETVEEIAKYSALQAARDYKASIFVEDTGLFIDALNGFPGPYASYVYTTTDKNGILKLLEGVTYRKAVFRSAVAFCDIAEKVSCFTGECIGNISSETRGDYGFGFDPIFKPLNGAGKTFAEMRLDEKSAISHRFYALRKFADWYVKSINVLTTKT